MRLLEEVGTDWNEPFEDEESEDEPDNIEMHSTDSDTEQDGKSDDESLPLPPKNRPIPSFIGKDGCL